MRKKPFTIERSEAIELFRNEISILEKTIQIKSGYITNLNYAGSLRREKSRVGDLDGIISTNDIKILRSALQENGYENIFGRMICKKKIPYNDEFIDIDLFISENYNWGNVSLWSCGSEYFNNKFNSYINKQGFKRNLWHIKKNNLDMKLNFKKEEEIFSYFDLPYIEPKMRNLKELEL